MLGGFQDYLVERGWKRYTKENNFKIEYNYKNNFLSNYGPTTYFFSHVNYPELELWYGICEKDKPPCFSVYPIDVIINCIRWRTKEDAYRIILANIDFNILYDMLIKQDRYFEINDIDDILKVNVIQKDLVV